MIDKKVIASLIIHLLVIGASSAPANSGLNSNEDPSTRPPSNSTESFPSDISTALPLLDSTTIGPNETETISYHPAHSSAQLIATPSPKSSPKVRKTTKDDPYCCDDDLEHVTEPSRRNRDRERNTKPPVLRRGKDPEEDDPEEPAFERRPALLLRFFPDGTAVLISKFQLHLHVKPKQVKFVPEDKEEHFPVELRPGFFLEDGKSYEVSYKRLEAIPYSREQNAFDLDESEDENEAYNEDPRHELVTPLTSTDPRPSTYQEDGKPQPLRDSPDATTEAGVVGGPTEDQSENASQISDTPVGDGPVSAAADELASSSREQRAQAEPLKVTTTATVGSPNVTAATTEDPKTTQMPTTSTSTVSTTTTTPVLSTEPTTSAVAPTVTTPKCPSFKNQVSLALSTEDNIGNSLLKKNILPTEDCDSPESEISSNSIAKLQSTETTTSPPSPTALPLVGRPTPLSHPRNHLAPYLASRYSGDPSKPDVVVVTSLPVLIDLKSNKERAQPVTNVPSWREVTVGVVRDQQGQPLKPRYNNWVSHLRWLRKPTDGRFWKDLTTPRPSPPRQQIQQAPSVQQVNRAFWADLQRQRPGVDPRGARSDQNDPRLYRSDPPRNYPVPSKNEFQFWRHGFQQGGNRWNGNSNNVPEYERKGPLRNGPLRNYENQDHQPMQQWNRGNTLKNHRRW